MAPLIRGFILASASLSILTLAACGTTGTGSNMSNQNEASRVDAILDRAAREAKASGNKAETVVLLEKIYQRNPDDAAVATSFAQALREDEQTNRARQIVYPFTEGKNAYPDAVIELAMIQLALGSYKEAELTARRAVELDPDSGRAYLALGTALDAQNYHEPAEVAFRKGIDNWQGDPAPIMNNLALNLASQNKLDQALDMLRKAKEISPGRVELERNMRIISTLKESADDFLIKQASEKSSPKPAAQAPVKETAKQAVKPSTETTVKTETVTMTKTTRAAPTQKELDNKQLGKPTGKVVKQTKTTKTVVDVETKSVNRRGSTQSFNKGSGND